MRRIPCSIVECLLPLVAKSWYCVVSSHERLSYISACLSSSSDLRPKGRSPVTSAADMRLDTNPYHPPATTTTTTATTTPALPSSNPPERPNYSGMPGCGCVCVCVCVCVWGRKGGGGVFVCVCL